LGKQAAVEKNRPGSVDVSIFRQACPGAGWDETPDVPAFPLRLPRACSAARLHPTDYALCLKKSSAVQIRFGVPIRRAVPLPDNHYGKLYSALK
jgi:hypothetical protein